MTPQKLKYILAAAVSREPYDGPNPHWPTLHWLRHYDTNQQPETQIDKSIRAVRANHSAFIQMKRETIRYMPSQRLTPESWAQACTHLAKTYRQHFRALARALTQLRNIDT